MSPERLTTWPEIAAYIGRDVRTAKRYEAARGLPVRRVPGGGKAPVYAFRDELDAWLGRGAAPSIPAAAAVPSAERRSRLRPWALGVGAGLAALVAVAVVTGGVRLRTAAARAPDARAVARRQAGDFAWRRRTPEGLRAALDAYTQAVVLDPGYAPAYVGLADTYDVAPEFAGMAPAYAYPRARAAAERAIALDPRSAAAHRALGFVVFWWAQKPAEAFREFEAALQLDPHSAQTHHWYANALAERGDVRALPQIDAALALDPAVPVMADKGWVLAMLGRDAEAEVVLRQVTSLEPGYAPAHDHLAMVMEHRGLDAQALAERRTAAELRHDDAGLAVVASAQAGLKATGRRGMNAAAADTLERLLASGETTAFRVACAEARRGDGKTALALLRRAKADRDPVMLGLGRSPEFAALRSDAEFKALLN